MTRDQIIQVLNDVLGDRVPAEARWLYEHAERHLRPDRTYLICADEF